MAAQEARGCCSSDAKKLDVTLTESIGDDDGGAQTVLNPHYKSSVHCAREPLQEIPPWPHHSPLLSSPTLSPPISDCFTRKGFFDLSFFNRRYEGKPRYRGKLLHGISPAGSDIRVRGKPKAPEGEGDREEGSEGNGLRTLKVKCNRVEQTVRKGVHSTQRQVDSYSTTPIHSQPDSLVLAPPPPPPGRVQSRPNQE
uniref:Uncharacterized protein n=1 Tax=Physcomitrium patens TaxID=3218 RepID=A0A2K1ITL4_PHYPA|nr:hypothetical protein PHYPA_024556 [Physcomitrium patens]